MMKHSSLFIAVLLTLGLVSCNQNVPEWREQYREATCKVVRDSIYYDVFKEHVVLFQTGQDEYRIRDLSTGGTCREFIIGKYPFIGISGAWLLVDWKWNLAANYNNVVIPMPWDAVRQPDAKYVRSDFKVIESNVFAKCSTIKRSEIDRYLGITPAPAADYPGPWGRTSGGISTDHLAPVYLNRYYSVQDIPDVIDRKGDWTYTKEDFLKERKRQDSLQNVYVKRLVTLINEGDADIVFPLISE